MSGNVLCIFLIVSNPSIQKQEFPVYLKPDISDSSVPWSSTVVWTHQIPLKNSAITHTVCDMFLHYHELFNLLLCQSAVAWTVFSWMRCSIVSCYFLRASMLIVDVYRMAEWNLSYCQVQVLCCYKCFHVITALWGVYAGAVSIACIHSYFR